MSVDHESCVGAAYHAPLPLWTERHHIFPKYLSALLGVAEVPLLAALCSNCHTRVHHALHHLINAGTNPHRLSDGESYLLNLAWSWWSQELLEEAAA